MQFLDDCNVECYHRAQSHGISTNSWFKILYKIETKETILNDLEN